MLRRLFRVLPAIAMLTFSSCGTLAASLAQEYLNFETVCLVVEIEADTHFEEMFDRRLVSEGAIGVIEQLLRNRPFNYPVESGRQCFPGKVGSAPRQLSLQFHVTVASGSNPQYPIATAVIAHSFYEGISRPPHNYPTKIGFCANADRTQITACMQGHIVKYFDDIVLPAFERVEPHRTRRPK